ncbi:MAG: transcription termination factor Rho [Planctomycetota bacterium]|nr:transcription termination factor Rho [Planctomycetota bacterium]
MQTVTGIVDWPDKPIGSNPGRLRPVADSWFASGPTDPVLTSSVFTQFGLRPGLEVTAVIGEPKPLPPDRGSGGNDQRSRRGGPGNRNRSNNHAQRPGESRSAPYVERVVAIEGMDPADYQKRKPFEELTSIDPQPRITLEYPGCPASCRLIDLFCPIGRGQRALIVSPPKAGKTTLLKDIALSVLRNHADLELVVLLVDERPEEVTDFRRTFVKPPGELSNLPVSLQTGLRQGQSWDPKRVRVVASSNDHDVARHVSISQMTIDRCKRMVEAGRHVVVLLDSLTRLGRAFNQSRQHASSGRTMTGGLDSKALEVPKQLFGAARCTEEAGSLTIIASCLVDTGSAADQVIFEEFKGTGNMELILDRKIAEKRIFPAMNLAESGTRKEHLLMGEAELKTMTALRRRLLAMPPHQQAEQLLAALQRFPTNGALVGSVG